ncbi:hypothetical protein PPO43_07170 [Saprospira sp. CCB-QB6]|uniref:hypothetical protein n=1 Tax=Saprospira sp. CCB-QB6 TaxID=3023936 RepID=UPI00234A15A5|nr:hypothetical protein [Saprospira sp. CCB-QB6]WCL82868.1 hypothetical protein PPO43_07170 [Saprospira sp. CCB-QB6]
MNIIRRIFALSILMILGFSALLAAAMTFMVENPDSHYLWPYFLGFGLLTGPGSLWAIIYYNQQFKQLAKKEALSKSERILGQWQQEDGQEVLLTLDALFLGKSHYPFWASYERLLQIEVVEDQPTLRFQLEVGFNSQKKHYRDIYIDVPQDLLAQRQTWAQDIQTASAHGHSCDIK